MNHLAGISAKEGYQVVLSCLFLLPVGLVALLFVCLQPASAQRKNWLEQLFFVAFISNICLVSLLAISVFYMGGKALPIISAFY